MRRIACLIVTLALAALSTVPARAQGNLPPHSWLFGAWTGGIFPPPSTLSAQECLAMPVVIFTRDIVMRAVITDQLYTQRLVETARVTPEGVEFRLTRPPSAAPAGPFSLSPAAAPTMWASAASARTSCACSAAPRTRSASPAAPISPTRWCAAQRAENNRADNHQETSPR